MAGENKVSVIIAALNEQWLPQTIDDLIAKATGDIEVVVCLDGYWPDPPLRKHNNLILLHRSTPGGMRNALNGAASVATGKYLMKIDAHCMVSEGYDEILKKDCEYDWLAVPSRHSLIPETWSIREGRWRAVEYNYLTFPYIKDDQFGHGLHGRKWTNGKNTPSGYYFKEIEREKYKIDDIISWQGSCWFIHRQKYMDIGMLDTVHSYNMFMEAQELGFKVWLSGGRVIINKNCWYAHWHRTERGFKLSAEAKRITDRLHTWYWMNNKWPKRTRDIEWLIDKFMPMPGWPENWKELVDKEKPELRIFDEKGNNGLWLS